MSYSEKSQWTSAVAISLASAVYFTWLAFQLGEHPVQTIDYGFALTVTGGVALVIHAMSQFVVRDSVAKGDEPSDTRLRDLSRYSESRSLYVLVFLLLAPLYLGLGGYEPFWIVNSLIAALLLAGVFGAVFKAVLLRKNSR